MGRRVSFWTARAGRHAAWGALVLIAGVAVAAPWGRLEDDGIHDRNNPGLPMLQQPADALSPLPPAKGGNGVDWRVALESGAISPRPTLDGAGSVKTLDLDILMKRTGQMPWVRFSHAIHTPWLDCSNCHEQIFATKAGETPVSMAQILEGRFCGVCHRSVAFPVTECDRCHREAQTAAGTK
ncbi:MAG: hypothetical protein HYV63_00845 [Candidatus Schekmanbacteria bacterium]|nr:hypothetical protein [Candidatus Schekmanbacteria bacterium]